MRGPSKVLRWDEQIAVWVWVSWDGAPKERLRGWCFAYSHEFVGVHITDPTTHLSYNAWVPAGDVARRDLEEDVRS